MPRPYWPIIERFFGSLTDALHAQGVLLRHTLGGTFSDTGQFADILTRPGDYPLLELPVWLSADWGAAENQRVEIEQKLLPALALQFCANFLTGAENPFDTNFKALAEALRAEARKMWPEIGKVQTPAAQPLFELGLFAAQAASTVCQRPAETPALIEGLQAFHSAYQLRDEVLNIRRDLACGVDSSVIQAVRQTLGLPPEQKVAPEKILGALVLTNAAEKLHQQALSHLALSRAHAHACPSFLNFLDGFELHLNDVFTTLSLKGQPRHPVRFAPITNPTTHALQMAEQFLLADTRFKESWEVQRRGLLGQPEVVSKTFGVGLVLEWAAPYLPALRPQVSAWFETYAQGGFRYYPHPAVAPDADDLGLALRLTALSPEPEKHRALLATPLRWLRASVGPNGHLPCWFTRGVEDLDAAQNTVLWGNNCLTVEANLLRGLLSFGRTEFLDLIEPAMQNWLGRWNAIGLGGNLFYGPLYALWAATELMLAYQTPANEFAATDSEAHLRRLDSKRIDEVLIAIAKRFQTEAAHIRTPQAAALALCLSARHPHLTPQPAWREMILNNQRYDGGWLAEPLFVAPTRGETAAWYASQTVTTALCYHTINIASPKE